ncbi:hypothetical protein NIA69_10285 [Gemmiger formicilis]|nr:hypothetical protein [Gemmiger formicilis]
MNWELIKHKFCRLVVTASLLLDGVMVSAAASGTMPLWAALLGLCCGCHAQRSLRHPAGHPGSGAAQGRTCPHQPPRRTTVRCARRARCLNMPTPICCESYNCGKPRAALAARGLPYPKAYVTMGKKQKDVT